MNKIVKVAFLISIGLFIIALTQCAYCTTSICRPGYDAFICGALLGFLMGGGAITWLANPFLFIAWISAKKNPTLSLVASLAAALIALSFLFFHGVADDEAGHINSIISYKLGYWLWLSSAAIILTGNVITFLQSRKPAA